MMSGLTTYNLEARITLFSTDLGGRENPVYSGYRPAFAFNTSIHYCGQIELIGKKKLRPGQSSRAHIYLLPAETISKNLKHHDAFILAEGGKVVGTGVIEAVEKI
jgi:translation elongation factor EF-Tu-like GTPase